MSIKELNKEQILELKQTILCRHNDSASYEELAKADAIISDNEVEKEYGHVDFTEDDFFCSMSA